MSKPTPDLPEEQVIEELLSWIARLEGDGCPPTGDCENYKVEGTLAVDCEMCRKEELKKLLHSLGKDAIFSQPDAWASERFIASAQIIKLRQLGYRSPSEIRAIERDAMERVFEWLEKEFGYFMDEGLSKIIVDDYGYYGNLGSMEKYAVKKSKLLGKGEG